jgi:pimeloyl-ACP methyl ester carboxylesterase
MLNGLSVSLDFNQGPFLCLSLPSYLSHRFQVYCVELYGFGRSSRVRWGRRWEGDSMEGSLDLMTAALEQWRETLQIPQFILVSHSLSCYVAIAYLLKYPSHVSHLYLTSPIGLYPTPSSFSLLSQEGALSFYSSSSQHTEPSQTLISSSWGSWCHCDMRSISELLWDNNWTPMDLLRWLGPLGPSLSLSTASLSCLTISSVRAIRFLSIHDMVSPSHRPCLLCRPSIHS